MRDDINDNLEREARNWIERQEAEKVHRAMQVAEDARHERTIKALITLVVTSVVVLMVMVAVVYGVTHQ